MNKSTPISNTYSRNKENNIDSSKMVQSCFNTQLQVHHRQGKGFRIDLGLNNGPFLPQDINAFNQKSHSLLAAKQILESHVSMSSLLQSLQTQQNMMIKSLPSSLPPMYKIQNFTAQFTFLDEEIKAIKQSSRKLKNQQEKLQKQIKKTYERFNNLNEQVVNMCTPVFSKLIKTVRSHHQQEKNLHQQYTKNIDNLITFRGEFLAKIVECEKQIIKFEGYLGVETFNEEES